MKKTMTILSICFFLLTAFSMQSQVLLAKWTFPTGNPTDSLPDGGVPANLSMSIHTEGGTSAIDFSKNGATTKAAQATGWDNGALLKCWVIRLNTSGFKNLRLSSKMQTGGNNPGPRDYSVQYRVGSAGTWTDIPNSTLVTANNWTSAVLDSIDIPEACNNQTSVYLRWIMTTNTNSAGGSVEATGINKIDDIYLTGKLVSTAVDERAGVATFTISPNPASGPVVITSRESIRFIEFFDFRGRIVYCTQADNSTCLTINPGKELKGMYLVRLHARSGQTATRYVVLL